MLQLYRHFLQSTQKMPSSQARNLWLRGALDLVCVCGGGGTTKYCPEGLLLIFSQGLVLEASLLLDSKQINVAGDWKNARN
jgi:hypothetical protein